MLEMKYFVLKPRTSSKNVGSLAHAEASRAAMLAYADAIDEHDHDLAAGLRWWAKDAEATDA